MTEKDYEIMRQCLTEGMQPKLNWYKSAIVNIDWNDEKELEPNLKCQVLYIAGLKDYICVPQTFADQKKCIANLEIVELDASHWTIEEKAEDVNQAVDKWIKKIL